MVFTNCLLSFPLFDFALDWKRKEWIILGVLSKMASTCDPSYRKALQSCRMYLLEQLYDPVDIIDHLIQANHLKRREQVKCIFFCIVEYLMHVNEVK